MSQIGINSSLLILEVECRVEELAKLVELEQNENVALQSMMEHLKATISALEYVVIAVVCGNQSFFLPPVTLNRKFFHIHM